MLHERVLAKFVDSFAGNLQMKTSVQERLEQLIKAEDVHKRPLSGTNGFCVFNSTLLLRIHLHYSLFSQKLYLTKPPPPRVFAVVRYL